MFSLVLASDISISNITKDNFASEDYEEKVERIFFRICFCSTIAYARSLMFVVLSMLISHTSQRFFVVPFVLVWFTLVVKIGYDFLWPMRSSEFYTIATAIE